MDLKRLNREINLIHQVVSEFGALFFHVFFRAYHDMDFVSLNDNGALVGKKVAMTKRCVPFSCGRLKETRRGEGKIREKER